MAGDNRGAPNKPPSKPLSKPSDGVDEDRREAAAAAYQRELAAMDLDAIGALDDEPDSPAPAPARPAIPRKPVAKAPARREPVSEPSLELAGDGELEGDSRDEHAGDGVGLTPPSREPSATRRPNLEPITDEAHPPENRRTPTQPPSAFELFLEETGAPSPPNSPPKPGSASATAQPAVKPVSRHSPAPVRRGLFSTDRITNLLAGAAIGLLISVFPAKKLAQSYETREVEPRLDDLEMSIRQTLAVEAGLVERPESVVASIDAGRSKVRLRFTLIWLLAGLPIGLGLGFAPRPGD